MCLRCSVCHQTGSEPAPSSDDVQKTSSLIGKPFYEAFSMLGLKDEDLNEKPIGSGRYLTAHTMKYEDNDVLIFIAEDDELFYGSEYYIELPADADLASETAEMLYTSCLEIYGRPSAYEEPGTSVANSNIRAFMSDEEAGASIQEVWQIDRKVSVRCEIGCHGPGNGFHVTITVSGKN